MNKEKVQYYSHLLVVVLGAMALLFLLFRYLLMPTLPFLLAWLLAIITRPIARRISKRTKINERAVSTILTALATLLLIALLLFGVFYLLSELWWLVSDLLSNESLPEFLSKITNPLASLIGEGVLGEDVEVYLSKAIKDALSGVLTAIVNTLGGILKGIPSVLLFILVTVISAIYFSYDLDRINSLVKRILPKPLSACLGGISRGSVSVVGKYVRSYLLLMLITYFVMLVGFLVLGVEKAAALALISALLDVLPLVGTGIILVPMSVYQLIFGKITLGVGILVLFALYQVLRQIIEPRIIGKSLGVHPLLSLALIYIGYGIFGIAGLLLMPLFSVILGVLFNKNDTAKISEQAAAEGDNAKP